MNEISELRQLFFCYSFTFPRSQIATFEGYHVYRKTSCTAMIAIFIELVILLKFIPTNTNSGIQFVA